MTDDEVRDEQADQVEGEPQEEGGEAKEGEKESLEAKLKEVVQVEAEDTGTLRKKLTISVPPEAVGEQVDEQYGELRREAMVPGFRKGRAPRRLLEKRFGNEVSETLVQQFVGTGYSVAVDKLGLKVLGDPLIWVGEEGGGQGQELVEVREALERIKLPADGPLVFSCEVEVRPEFELPELEGIPLEKPVLTVSDQDVDVQVERIRAMRGTWEPVADGAVVADDLVTADVKMSSGGTVLKEEEAVQLAARPQQVDGVSLEKLGETLVGARAGEVRTISSQLGDDYAKAEFRGQQADFEFKIRGIQRQHLPELDDQLVKGFGFDTVAEMRNWIHNDLESRIGTQVRQVMHGQVYKYLLDKVSFELPERLSNRQITQVVAKRMLDLYQQGVPPEEVNKRMDELKTGAREDALRELKLAFVMEKLAETFETDVSEEEVNSRIAAFARQQGRRFDRVRDELAKQGALVSLFLRIRDEKIVDQLVAKAKVTESQPQGRKKGAERGAAQRRTDRGAKSGAGGEAGAVAEGAAVGEGAEVAEDAEAAKPTEPQVGLAPPEARSSVKRKPPRSKKSKTSEEFRDET